ncbi:serine/threonine protein kinase, partial [Halomonas litopenaei]|nr:serine/threonine protein kinase [Halomonas litopenaei]
MNAATQPMQGDEQQERSEALPDGTHLLGDQFTVERALSNGGFGITYLARDNYLDRRVVIKECYPEVFCMRQGKNVLVRSDQHKEKYRTIVKMFMREARSIAKMRHPNIVGVHRIFEDNQTAYMVLDLIHGRDLLSIVNDKNKPLPPAQIKEILIKVLDAVDLVHQNDLLHRDI